MKFLRGHYRLFWGACILICAVILIVKLVFPSKDFTGFCPICEPTTVGPLYIVCTGTGKVCSVDAFGQNRLLGKQEEYGYGEFISSSNEKCGCSYSVFRDPDFSTATVRIQYGKAGYAKRGSNQHFCEECANKMNSVVTRNQKHTYVLYDAESDAFYPITEDLSQIGYYYIETEKTDEGLKLVFLATQ